MCSGTSHSTVDKEPKPSFICLKCKTPEMDVHRAMQMIPRRPASSTGRDDSGGLLLPSPLSVQPASSDPTGRTAARCTDVRPPTAGHQADFSPPPRLQGSSWPRAAAPLGVFRRNPSLPHPRASPPPQSLVTASTGIATLGNSKCPINATFQHLKGLKSKATPHRCRDTGPGGDLSGHNPL